MDKTKGFGLSQTSLFIQLGQLIQRLHVDLGYSPVQIWALSTLVVQLLKS